MFHIESFVIFGHCRSSLNSSVSSCQIVSRVFSPVIHMNLHLVEDNLGSSLPVDQSPVSMVGYYVGLCQELSGFHMCAGYDPDPSPGDLLPS